MYHLDVLLELLNKTQDELEKHTHKSQLLFKKRNFTSFWDSLNVVNIVLKKITVLVTMIEPQIKYYRDARKKIITKSLKNISVPPVPNTPSLNVEAVKVSFNTLKEILDSVSLDFEFTSALRQIFSHDTMSYDMTYSDSIPKMLDSTLEQLESCLVDINYLNGAANQRISTIPDVQEQKTEREELTRTERQSTTEKPSSLVDKEPEVTGRKPRKDTSVSQGEPQSDKGEDVVTGRKPRVDNSKGGNALSDKSSETDTTDVTELYAGRKPRRI